MRKIIAVLLLFLALTLVSCGKENSDFIIKDGVLTEYTGTNTVVEIPSKVKEIADFAFSKSPACDGITEITLGKNVKTISPKAFFGLYGLIKVNADDNADFVTEYKQNDNAYALYAKNSPVMFYFTDKTKNSIYSSTETDLYRENEKVTLAVSDALLEMSFEKDGDNLYWFVHSVTYGEKTWSFDPQNGFGFTVYAFLTDDAFVYMIKNYDDADSYIFVGDKIYDVCTFQKYGEDFGISFYPENGKLKYLKTARKFLMLWQNPSYNMPFCLYELVSRDEFCSEYGSVNISENGLEYVCEESYNISEYIEKDGSSLDEAFEKLNSKTDVWGDEEYDTLDELIEANRKRMEETQ